jgi:hypothetical protein
MKSMFLHIIIFCDPFCYFPHLLSIHPIGLFPSRFPINVFYMLPISLICEVTNLTLLDLSTLIAMAFLFLWSL